MQIGIDSFVAAVPDTLTGENLGPADRLSHLLEEIQSADRVGLDVFGIGEHHRAEFLDSAPETILAAAAVRTERIRLTSAVTVLSANDPVRIFQQFATIDLLSRGRAEMIVGRGSFVEAFPLFGLDLADYDSLFASKLELLLKIRDNSHVHWAGQHRAPLTGQAVYPRPYQRSLPIWLGVGGTPASFARAGTLGLPLMVAIIGGEPRQFRPLIDLYREAGRRAGHPLDRLKVGIHALGYVADTDQQAAEEFFPGYARSFTEIGKERGWPPITRRQFEALLEPEGALLVGDPQTVADKILSVSEALGGIERLSFQMSIASLPHAKRMHAIELLGAQVAPAVREHTPAVSAAEE
ncbi:MAG: LLM class flavin-dependent oxidoreductase [Candidatus Acidiferrum sp.]|jgi:probable LLM family oxidoreductase